MKTQFWRWCFGLLGCLCCNFFLWAEIEIYFSPQGGFSLENRERTITLSSGEQVAANLNLALLDLIERSQEGSTIKMAMYSFSYRPVQEALIAAAKNRHIHIKLLVDGTAEWTRKAHHQYAERVVAELTLARQEKRPFDFQVKEVSANTMLVRGRLKKIADGTIIYGTMHEKFGIFYNKGSAIPLHSFCGSANISMGAGESAAENRVFFFYEPGPGSQLAEEFARLWNEFGTPLSDNCESEKFIPAGANLGEVRIIFNSRPVDEEQYDRIDDELLHLIGQVSPEGGTLDVAMFSFTSSRLAHKILGIARQYPGVQVRLLLDMTQLEADADHANLLGPFIEKEALANKLTNIQVRYKWRSNALTWDWEKSKCVLVTFRNLLFHHKCVVVNNQRMAMGSYNWSSSAESRNLENLMLFYGEVPQQQKVIGRFMAEYEAAWNALRSEGPITAKIPNPQVVTGPQGRELHKKIVDTFQDAGVRKIMRLIDKTPGGCTIESLVQETRLDATAVSKKIKQLEVATLIFANLAQDGVRKYCLAD